MNIEILRTLTENAKQAKTLNEINENLAHFAKYEPEFANAAKDGRSCFSFEHNFPYSLTNGTLEKLKELYPDFKFYFNSATYKSLTVSWE